MMPTLAELCGLRVPDDRVPDGVSIVPALDGATAASPDRLLFTHVGRWDFIDRPVRDGRWSVRSPRFRLMFDGELHDIDADPGQSVNVAADHPDEVKRLRAAFERWWEAMLPSLTEKQRISVGSPYEAPAHLSCMDWQQSREDPTEPDWRNAHIWMQRWLAAVARHESFPAGNGFAHEGTMGSWAVNVRRAASYAVTLSKLPRVAPPAWNALRDGEAHVRCRGTHETKTVRAGVDSVTIVARFEQGPADLECWFTGQRDDGERSGAYFTEVKYLG